MPYASSRLAASRRTSQPQHHICCSKRASPRFRMAAGTDKTPLSPFRRCFASPYGSIILACPGGGSGHGLDTPFLLRGDTAIKLFSQRIRVDAAVELITTICVRGRSSASQSSPRIRLARLPTSWKITRFSEHLPGDHPFGAIDGVRQLIERIAKSIERERLVGFPTQVLYTSVWSVWS